MENIKFHFEELRAYQKSLDYIDSVYEITKKFPKEERYGLTSQFIRATASIALNIAEGAGGTGDTNAQFITETEENENRITLSQMAKMIMNL